MTATVREIKKIIPCEKSQYHRHFLFYEFLFNYYSLCIDKDSIISPKRTQLIMNHHFLFTPILFGTILLIMGSGALADESGSLSLSTVPPGAAITLDGSLQSGQTPLTLSDILPGSHTITLTKSGYQDLSMTVPVVSGEKGQFSLSLSPDSGAPIQPVPGKESNGEDLTVREIALVYYKPDSNEISTDLTIKNKGTAATSKFEVTYFLSPDKASTPFMDTNGKEVILGRDDINSLSAGQDRRASTMKTFLVSDIQPGTYWFGVYVDSQNKVTETDESNNIFYWKEQIPVKVTGDRSKSGIIGPVSVIYTISNGDNMTSSNVVNPLMESETEIILSSDEWVEKGKSSKDVADYYAALNAYEKALELNPKNYQALREIALVYSLEPVA